MIVIVVVILFIVMVRSLLVSSEMHVQDFAHCDGPIIAGII